MLTYLCLSCLQYVQCNFCKCMFQSEAMSPTQSFSFKCKVEFMSSYSESLIFFNLCQNDYWGQQFLNLVQYWVKVCAIKKLATICNKRVWFFVSDNITERILQRLTFLFKSFFLFIQNNSAQHPHTPLTKTFDLPEQRRFQSTAALICWSDLLLCNFSLL